VAVLDVEWLGRVPYPEALALQQRVLDERRRGAIRDRLLLLEHPAVVTFGSGAHAEHLLVSEHELAARGVALHVATRGGDVTYHAPGQLVGYLVVDLAARAARDVHAFLRAMEGALIDALAKLGVSGARIPGMTGVFVAHEEDAGPTGFGSSRRVRKLASIGIGVRHWITWHGFALNVGLDLAGFDVIVPCGLSGVEMTSVARELGVAPGSAPALESRARGTVSDAFRHTFETWPTGNPG